MTAARLSVALGLVAALLGRVATATEAPPAEAMIRKTVDEAFAVLKDPKLAGKAHRTERLAALRTVADRTFDWAEMGRASLGAPWRTLPTRRSARASSRPSRTCWRPATWMTSIASRAPRS